MTRDDLAGTLVQLRRRVDLHFDAAVARSPSSFTCTAGCAACCHARFSVFAVEAAAIRQALARLAAEAPDLRARVRRQADDPAHQDRCALLVDDRCSIYAERPVICRSHGLPVLTEGHVDHCPLNFTEHAPPSASVLRLDAVNQPLAVIATLWDQERSPSDPPSTVGRVDLADLARDPDPAPSPSKPPPAPLSPPPTSVRERR